MRSRRDIERALRAAREALDELEGATLSGRSPGPGVLARVLRAVLQGQIALLASKVDEAATEGEETGPIRVTIPGATPGSLDDTGPIDALELAHADGEPDAGRIKPIPPEVLEDDLPIAPTWSPRGPRRGPARKLRREDIEADTEDDLDEHPPARPRPEPPPPPRETPGAAASPPPAPGGAPRSASETAEAEALVAFPAEEMNRWLSSGTIFQIRGALAFLNLRSMGGLRADELRGHIRRMGFDEEVGKLGAASIAGEVLLFRRADG